MVSSAKPLLLSPLQRMLEKTKNQPFAMFFSHHHTPKTWILRTYILADSGLYEPLFWLTSRGSL